MDSSDGIKAGMVIVGAGQSGMAAGLALREQGYGGPVTLIGDEPHLPYERPPLSKQAMLATEEPVPAVIAEAAHLAALKIDLVSGVTVATIDRADKQVLLGDGSAIAFDKLLLATGATPRPLPLAQGHPRCRYLRDFADALEIRRHLQPGQRIAVIGGGYIGLELAASATQRCCQVTVIEAQPRLLMRGVPPEIASVIRELHERQGVRILCGAELTAIDAQADGVCLTLGDGTAIAADLCIIGIGAVPRTALAVAAGLAVENGVKVCATLATSDPDIFAAGDCCAFALPLYGDRWVRLESWRNAQDQGQLAARNMLGAGIVYDPVPWFWSDQYHLGLQIAGLPDEGIETVRRDLGADAFMLFHLAADGRLIAASGIGSGNAVAKDIRLAEMLIARRSYPPRDKLAASETKLKSLLAA
jgi:3-phenylpropionate/trans-cinnamate dioxygenase ferredoxin reductase subunit